MTNDRESVTVGGLKWFPKGEFFFFINCGELNFPNKCRGRKTPRDLSICPKGTVWDCVGKVEVFDPLGRVSPRVAGMKLDIHELNSRKLDWDSKIPEDLKKIWSSNFEMIQEISKIRFHRSIVPSDAMKLDIETIDVADASPFIICVAIYARFERRNGECFCQLVFARTKIVPKDTSMPRAELLAATLKVVHWVKRAKHLMFSKFRTFTKK